MLADNVVHFTRALRRAGVAVGPDRALAALQALEAVGFARRDDVHAALAAVMLERHEQQPVFDATFDAFWRDPRLLERVMSTLLPQVAGRREVERGDRPRRVEEALAVPRERPRPARETSADETERVDLDATFTWSDRERLQTVDFEAMTTAEFDAARRLAEELPLPLEPVRRRRREPHAHGAIDLRASLRRMARSPDLPPALRTRPRFEAPPLVVLLDVSGSMERYARIMLHWLHGLARRERRVSVFTFGTRLTPITRALRNRDPDHALALASRQVADWKGGTRIAHCLDDFNRHWARRVLGGGAALVLVTDGLDTDAHGELGRAAAQLRRHAREILWLNPLLRYAGFEPRAGGVRALLPHVDRMLPMHDLKHLADLGRALRAARPTPIRSMETRTWN